MMTAFEKDVITRLTRMETAGEVQTGMIIKINKEGCDRGHIDRQRLEALERGKVLESSDSNGKLSIGKWIKAGGVPAIIIATFIGMAIYQRYVANDLKAKTDKQVQLAADQARNALKTVLAELRSETPAK